MKLPTARRNRLRYPSDSAGVSELLPHFDEYWRDQFVNRHIDRLGFNLTSYPPNSPLSARPGLAQRLGAAGRLARPHSRNALDPFGTRFAICNTLHGAIALFNEDMAAAICSAVNS